MQETNNTYFGDRSGRQELQLGTYEFLAPAEYSNKPIPKPTYLIILETSTSA
jgi:hypothetical protein